LKVFKLNEHSVFPRPFGVRDKMYLAVGIMIFFDLTASDMLLTEQELWKTVPAQLGPMPMLDQGIPKARGEFLAAGSCFAPRGELRQASQVRIRVGEVEKKISVYGNRYWKNGLITDAEPFSEIPVSWERAFGGEGYAKNPVGKGLRGAVSEERDGVISLPNLEYAEQQKQRNQEESHPHRLSFPE
jgi:hypothetical protein